MVDMDIAEESRLFKGKAICRPQHYGADARQWRWASRLLGSASEITQLCIRETELTEVF
jgi:hypothetical protein